MATIYTDPITGVYEDDQNKWFLKSGTPIIDYDPKTGAFQEADGSTWYTFQGVPLMNYSKDIGAYQEDDGTWYTTSGTEVLLNSAVYNQLKAYGFDVSANTTPQGGTPKTSKNTTAASNSSNSWVLPAVGIFAAVTIITIIIIATRKKK